MTFFRLVCPYTLILEFKIYFLDHEQGEQQEDALAIFTETVQRTEARCAGIHEELGRMALSEQYMRTKQAQLRAKKKAYEAKEALERAEAREKEAVVSFLSEVANL